MDHFASQPDADQNIIGLVWWCRLSMLVIFGQQFQIPLNTQTCFLLAVFTALVIDDIHRKAEWYLGSGNNTVRLPYQSRWQDGMVWVQCVTFAALAVYVLHRKPALVRFCCIGLCCVLLGSTLVVDPTVLRAASPFYQFDARAAGCCILLVYSALYHSRRGLNDYNTYAEWVVWLLRQVRERYERTEQRGLRPLDLEASERRACLLHNPLPASVESRNRDSLYAQWETGIRYGKLVGDQIRLLEILGGESSEIKCTLKHYSMSQVDNVYTALSYHWGKDVQKHQIEVNEKTIWVPANLCHALKEIRHHENTLLWVDLLCINQGDLHERSAQLLRMGSIFRKARQVVAWLGTEDPASKTIMTALTSNPASKHATFPPREIHYSSDDVRSFVDRPFWKRVWIIQEIANAAHVVFICGDKQVLLDEVRSLVRVWLGRESTMNWPQFVGNLQLIDEILEIRNRRYSEQTLGLLEALAKTWRSESSVRHDKVFGLLGLANDQDDFMRYAPDYAVSEDEMSMKMTRSFLVTRKSLDIVLAGPRKMMASSLPSWCPDYFHVDEEQLDEKFVHYLLGKDIRYRLGEQRPFWATTASSQAAEGQNFWVKKDVLQVHAVHIGTIDGVNGTSEDDETAFTVVRRKTGSEPIPSYSTHDGLTRMLLIYDRKYEKFTSAPLALWQLYTMPYKSHAALTGGDADVVLGWLQKNKDFDIHGKTLHDRALYSARRITSNWCRALLGLNAHITNLFDYGHLTSVIAEIVKEGLHLITLQQGQVGWADPHARLDDEIFMLAGCSVPVVLRQQPGLNQYQVVGRAYVDGYMDGEEWTKSQQTRPNGSRTVTVEIC